MSGPNGRLRRGLLVLVLQAILAAPTATPAAASSHYDGTFPDETGCDSDAVTWRSYLIRDRDPVPGPVFAKLQIRYSDACHTVWTRVENLTGSGAGYAGGDTAMVLRADTRIYVYDCPKPACLLRSRDEIDDRLATTGSSSFSEQLTIPSGRWVGSPRNQMPPTVRARAWVTTPGGSTYTMDTQLEPVWTQVQYNKFDNDPSGRDGSRVLSCENVNPGGDFPACVSWGQRFDGSRHLLWAELDPSLGGAMGPADLARDMREVAIPAWNAAWDFSPRFRVCDGSCSTDPDVRREEDLIVQLVAQAQMADPDNVGETSIASTLTTPRLAFHSRIKINSRYRYDHGCGNEGNGCPDLQIDDSDARRVLSHELGHAYGLGHCDLDRGVMCAITARGTEADADGDGGHGFWTPQQRDRWALKAVYPASSSTASSGAQPGLRLVRSMERSHPVGPVGSPSCHTVAIMGTPIRQTVPTMAGLSSVIIVGTFGGYGRATWNTPAGTRPSAASVDAGHAIVVRPARIVPSVVLRGSEASLAQAEVVGGAVGCDSVSYSEELDIVAGGRYVFFLAPVADGDGEVRGRLRVMEAWPIASRGLVSTPWDGAMPLTRLANAMGWTSPDPAP